MQTFGHISHPVSTGEVNWFNRINTVLAWHGSNNTSLQL